MSLYKTLSMDTGLAMPRSATVSRPWSVDDRRTENTSSPRANVPAWYRGLHQSLRTLSQSGLSLNQLDDDDDNDDPETFGTNSTNCRLYRLQLLSGGSQMDLGWIHS